MINYIFDHMFLSKKQQTPNQIVILLGYKYLFFPPGLADPIAEVKIFNLD